MSTLPAAPPSAIGKDGTPAFGRYIEPIDSPDLAIRPWQRPRLKEWHYTSLSTPRLFFAFGLVQLGYVANAFAYWVDHERPGPAREYSAISPLGRHLRFSESSTRGITRWKRKDARFTISYEPRLTQIHVDVKAGDQRLFGDVRIVSDESLALLFDLGGGRPAYTHKAAGLRAGGSLRLGDEALIIDGLATVDWTRSLASRRTVWKWASFAGTSGGRRVGLNLSADIYDDPAGESQENAFWIDGKVHPLGGVVFDVPQEPGAQDWRIRSRSGDDVDLTFRPMGARAQHLDLKILRSNFVQPYGRFTGRVLNIDVDVFGVVEDHDSIW